MIPDLDKILNRIQNHKVSSDICFLNAKVETLEVFVLGLLLSEWEDGEERLKQYEEMLIEKTAGEISKFVKGSIHES
jgi:hypothetical protein